MYHYVAAAGHAVQRNGPFHLHQLQWIAVVIVQLKDGMLAHFLLGGQRHPALAHGVKHLAPPITLPYYRFAVHFPNS